MIALLIGLIVDMIIGDPEHWTHPVRWIGRGIQKTEEIIYPFHNKRFMGGVLVVVILSVITGVVLGIDMTLNRLEWTWVRFGFHIYAFFAGIAFGSLVRIVKKVMIPFAAGDLDKARYELGFFVSRETKELTQEQVLKTVIETLAENTVDGIIAPVFYAFLGELFFQQGILCIWIYKGINTMDSMIGYKNARYQEFGYVAAKLDDVVNFIPARVGALLILGAGGLCGFDMKHGFKMVRRDHHKTESPNAGYPESAMAGLLGVQIGGTYTYFGKEKAKPTLGEALEPIHMKHVYQTKKLIWTMQVCMLILTCIVIMEGIL
ncbi:adenosylcobinamide-phosphate synthase CbiB [Vallitaleaceae bacterium 9-2]